MRQIAPLALPLLVAGLAQLTALTQMLGAHPWWASNVIWIGTVIGLVLAAGAWALKWPAWPRVGGALVLTAAAYGVATLGKARFAASFAEDAFAGQMWYFGWIATCAFAAAALASIVAPTRQAIDEKATDPKS